MSTLLTAPFPIFAGLPPLLSKWGYVEARFEPFLSSLAPTPAQSADAKTKVGEAMRTLNRHFGQTNRYLVVGSWGKGTVIAPPSDMDALYVLPPEIYRRYAAYTSNGQSSLLQEVKRPLETKNARTEVRGDRQVVVLEFGTMAVEVVPAFEREGGGYFICDAASGGSWSVTDPFAENARLQRLDQQSNGTLIPAIMALKQWKRCCNVPIKSFALEQLAIEAFHFMPSSYVQNRWFDWIMRDIFARIRYRAGGYFFTVGVRQERIELGDVWLSRAESAYARACAACDFEENNANGEAGERWRMIFGQKIPMRADPSYTRR